MRRILQRMGQDRLFDRRRNAVRVRPARSRQPIDQAVGAVQLKAPPDLVELLLAVAHPGEAGLATVLFLAYCQAITVLQHAELSAAVTAPVPAPLRKGPDS